MDGQRIGSSAYLLMSFREIENLMPSEEPADKTRMLWFLLKGHVLSYIELNLRKKLEAEDSELLENDLIELVIRKMYIGLQDIPK
jgi:hypothetical protein